MTNERPILWSDPMVRAIMNTKPGTYPGEPIDPSNPAKWQTRRVMAKQPGGAGVILNKRTAVATWAGPRGERIDLACPFGKPGDLLYGRECWAVDHRFDDRPPRELDHTPIRFRATPDICFRPWIEVGEEGRVDDERHILSDFGHWRPSIHMPRDFARIWHEIVGVRVDRLWDITPGDIEAEGACAVGEAESARKEGMTAHVELCRNSWTDLWVSVYGEESWEANPWLWIIDLKRIDHNATGASVGVSDG